MLVDNQSPEPVDFRVTWKLTNGVETVEHKWEPTLEPYTDDTNESIAVKPGARTAYHASVVVEYRFGKVWVIDAARSATFVPRNSGDFDLPEDEFF